MDVDLTPRILTGTSAGDLHHVAMDEAADPLLANVRDLYGRLDAEIAAKRPVCTNRGDCCKFEAYGHRLYVTEVELRFFTAHQRASGLRPVVGGSCPYQQEGRCTAREHRPLGCRVFFCDPNAQEWQPEVYEKYLGELKRIGAEGGVEYRYREWLAALGIRADSKP